MSDFTGVFRTAFTGNRTDAFVAAGVVGVILALLIPLPTLLLDVLLSFNLLLSILILLVVIYSRRVLDFTLFPTLLLVTTVFGLALNISTTRLILAKGGDFDGAVIKAFATFVVGATADKVTPINLVIGIVIFIILVAVQFLVITKGATRVAEVAARFTLDGLPAKQMTIDNSFSSGSITEEEALKRKSELQQEVDFFGAMDGASKFVQGNVQIGLLITFVNIIAGLVVGMTFHGEPFATAITTYTSLTIGDGLVSQLPSLMISFATGLLVTRSSSGQSIGSDALKQFTAQGRIYWIAAGFLVVLGLIPGFPWYILLPMAALMAYVGYSLSRKDQQATADATAAASGKSADTKADASKGPVSVAPLDPLSLELGYGLIPLVDKEQGAELLERVTRIRSETALELGLVVPRIRIIDNMRLEPSEYSLKIKGMEVGKGSIRMGHYMAINPGGEREEIPGEATKDPAFGLPALWITDENRDKAERAGYTVVDSPSIIATHLTEVIKKHSGEILGRQEVQSLLESVKADYPAVVDEVTKLFSTGELQKVLQGLLLEQVSIRNMVVILETLGDYGGMTKDAAFLIEKVRQGLSRQICLQYADDTKTLHVLTLDPTLEQKIIESRHDQVTGPVAALEPELMRKWINAVSNSFRGVQNLGYYPMILASEAARPLIKNSTLRDLPDLVVLSVPEIAPGIQVESVGVVRIEGLE
ncbi:MAG: flagellar biosynthesis protein FlhA [Spirochaetales bacterium]